jgi:hypothetical protein
VGTIDATGAMSFMRRLKGRSHTQELPAPRAWRTLSGLRGALHRGRQSEEKRRFFQQSPRG